LKNKQFLYLLLSFITLLTGYAFLRYAYKVTDTVPFTQEIVLIILGTLATIFITSLLLNKQTTVEIQKEQSIRFLELKTNTYEKLFDLLENMSICDKIEEKDIINLQFITHRLAIISSADVLNEYKNFVTIMNQLLQDNSFSGDSQVLHSAISKLTMKIRNDIINQETEKNYTTKDIEKIISFNSKHSADFRS
jgi:hypothetical protein